MGPFDNARRAFRERAERLRPVEWPHPRGRLRPLLPSSAPMWRRALRVLERLGQGVVLHGALRMAPAMAFHFFLSLMPLLAFSGYMLSLLAEAKGVDAVFGVLFDSLPQAAEPIVREEIVHLPSATRLGPIALLGFLWVASSGTHGLAQSVEALVGARRRPWHKQRLFALSWVVVALSLLAGASVSVIEWDAPSPTARAEQALERASGVRAGSNAAARRTDPPKVQHVRRPPKRVFSNKRDKVVSASVAAVVVVFGLAAFYWFSVSTERGARRRVFPGALVAVLVLAVASTLFSLYIAKIGTYTLYYGSLAAVAVLLVWFWLASFAILVGAELNAQLEGLRDSVRKPMRSAPE